jgi:copper resistance protein C
MRVAEKLLRWRAFQLQDLYSPINARLYWITLIARVTRIETNMKTRRIPALLLAIFGLSFLISLDRLASAHAVLVEATPTADSAIAGPDVVVKLRFNVRIDRSRSRLTLAVADGKTTALQISDQGSPDTVSARASGLGPGSYHLRWQVLAADGHITRGDIPFRVNGPKS